MTVNILIKENKYKKWYFSIVKNIKNDEREYNSNIHEKHHIFPKSMGGGNCIDNILICTFREHFILHMLLVKFTISPYNSKMHHALRMMMNKSVYNNRVNTQRQYETARTLLKKNKLKMSSDFCNKQKELKIGNKNPMFGKSQSEKQKSTAKNVARQNFSKTYIFLLNNKKIIITNLRKYCRDNNLSRYYMYRVYNKKIDSYKNYTSINF